MSTLRTEACRVGTPATCVEGRADDHHISARHPNGPGLQMATVRNFPMAWVLTLPAAITLSASLYILFLNIF